MKKGSASVGPGQCPPLACDTVDALVPGTLATLVVFGVLHWVVCSTIFQASAVLARRPPHGASCPSQVRAIASAVAGYSGTPNRSGCYCCTISMLVATKRSPLILPSALTVRSTLHRPSAA